MDYRRQLPDVWSRCKTYKELAECLIFGESKTPPDSIEQYANYEEAQNFLETWKKRISDAEELAAKQYEETQQIQSEKEQQAEELGHTSADITTKRDGMSIDPFKPILYPVQQTLAMICRYIRHARYVLFWEECYISFWVVTACFIVGTIFLFVPWFFLMTWTARALVWIFFGPWMKLVDIFYIRKIKPLSQEEIDNKKLLELERRRLITSEALVDARIKRENAAKLKAMKTYLFGKFISRVPVLKEDRYRDIPLPESTAVPYTPPPVPLSEMAMREAGYRRTRLPGQHLVGDMIPKVGIIKSGEWVSVCSPLTFTLSQIDARNFTEAPVGQAVARPKRVGAAASRDSTVDAYVRIGTLVLTAGFLTWFGVPFLASVTEHFVSVMWHE
jgi:hypothetical protein